MQHSKNGPQSKASVLGLKEIMSKYFPINTNNNNTNNYNCSNNNNNNNNNNNFFIQSSFSDDLRSWLLRSLFTL